MKKSSTILPLVLLLILGTSSCHTGIDPSDHPTYPKDAQLIRILRYINVEDKQASSTKEYEYDVDGRLVKTYRPVYQDGEVKGMEGYDEYEYDDQNQLVKIASFNLNSGRTFSNLKNILYIYDSNGYKEKETIHYPQINDTEHTIFHHDGNGRLILQENIDANDKSGSYHIFSYNAQGQMIEEKIFDVNQQLMRTHKNHYNNGNNTQTDIFVGDGDEVLRRITRTFDQNKNMIFLESLELSMLSSSTSYKLQYVYNQ